MRTRILTVAGMLVLAVVAVLLYQTRVRAQIPMADGMRFQMIGDEPIASPDGRSFVTNWKAVMLRDRRANQCYVAFITDRAMSLSGAVDCPR
jgi:hypothetical protein